MPLKIKPFFESEIWKAWTLNWSTSLFTQVHSVDKEECSQFKWGHGKEYVWNFCWEFEAFERPKGYSSISFSFPSTKKEKYVLNKDECYLHFVWKNRGKITLIASEVKRSYKLETILYAVLCTHDANTIEAKCIYSWKWKTDLQRMQLQ